MDVFSFSFYVFRHTLYYIFISICMVSFSVFVCGCVYIYVVVLVNCISMLWIGCFYLSYCKVFVKLR